MCARTPADHITHIDGHGPLFAVPFAPAGQARPIYPFTAVIGQEEMKLALILNVIDPKIGGVMIMGDRGTGKTTTIRALADLLPQVPVVAKDPFNSGGQDNGAKCWSARERMHATALLWQLSCSHAAGLLLVGGTAQLWGSFASS